MNFKIFYDLEFTCPDKHLTFRPEVIQIGAVKIDENNNSISAFSKYVRPTDNPIITDICKSLTGINQHDIDNSENFSTIFEEFGNWAGNDENTKFYSWGPDDIRVIRNEIIAKDIKLDFTSYFLNHCYDFQDDLKNQTGIILSLKKMLNCFGKEFDGTEHDALADAANLKDLYVISLNSPELIAKLKFESTLDASKHQIERIINLEILELNDRLTEYYNYICELNLGKTDISSDERDNIAEFIKNTVADMNPDIENYLSDKFYNDINSFIENINRHIKYDSKFINKSALSSKWHTVSKKYKFFYKHAYNSKMMFSFKNFYNLYKQFNDKVSYMLSPQISTQLILFNSEFESMKKKLFHN